VTKKGLVWTFKTHDGKAYNSKPINDASTRGLNEPLQLSWTAGDWAGTHNVYFGTNAGEVGAGTTTKTTGVFRGTVTSPAYPLARLLETGANPPGASFTLQAGTTYYWRVDEVNSTTVFKGNVWSFTPAAYINIDDFEDYNSTDELTANWPDGYSVTGCTSLTGNAGRVLIRDANGKYLQYSYSDSGDVGNGDPPWYFSEAKRPYSGGTSFTGGGVIYPAPKKLRIDYRGTAVNAADPVYDRMYVAIEDTAGNVSVYPNPDAHAAQVGNWTSWYIALTDINALGAPHPVKLNAVTGFAIGFGQRCNNYDFGGGDGNVMFDNIRLYAQTCNPTYGPTADFTGDCYVDLDDLMIMAQEWLIYNPPCFGGPCPGAVIILKSDLNHDYIVDFKDFAILGQEWRVQILWP
jgi:hypothetical protein